jgi:hypothetical protein
MRRSLVLAATAVAMIAGVTAAAAGKRLKIASETISVAPGQTLSVEASCKKGTKAVSGGFETESDGDFDPFLEVNRSQRSGRRGWISEAFNGSDEAGDLTSFAYCRRGKTLTREADTVPSPIGEFVTATAECPPRTRVISGGFAGSPTDAVGDTPVLYISESRRASKRTWEVSAHGNGNEPGELTSVAYCGKAKKLKQRSASGVVSTDIPDALTAELVARCKRRERVVAGGFGSTDDSGESTPRVLTSRKQGRRSWAVTAIVGSMGLTVDVTAYAYCEKR